MTADDLKAACRMFEEQHGVEAFLDTMAEIMPDRMKLQGLELTFFEADCEQTDPEETH
jgi:hypothetical protein